MISSKNDTLSVTKKMGKSIIAKTTAALATINFANPFAKSFNEISPSLPCKLLLNNY